MDKLAHWADFEDVSGGVGFVEECDRKNTELRYDWSQLEKLRNAGYQSQAKFELKTARIASTYRDVTPEVNLYRIFSKLGGSEIDETAANEISASGKTHPNPAQRCSSVDLRNYFGAIRNQSKTGYCFAFATADVLSYHLGTRISAWDVDLTFRGNQLSKNTSNKNAGLFPASALEAGGLPDLAFDDIQKRGGHAPKLGYLPNIPAEVVISIR